MIWISRISNREEIIIQLNNNLSYFANQILKIEYFVIIKQNLLTQFQFSKISTEAIFFHFFHLIY